MSSSSSSSSRSSDARYKTYSQRFGRKSFTESGYLEDTAGDVEKILRQMLRKLDCVDQKQRVDGIDQCSCPVVGDVKPSV